MAKKTLYLDDQCGLSSYAFAIDGKLCECAFEADNSNITGNIYKGKVTNLLNGMQAAFIDCGLEKNCYISADDLISDRAKYAGEEIDMPAALNLNVGDEIMVQVVKPPIGKKGAKVTTKISFIGNYCIYMPDTHFIGVSRKITNPEMRKNLIFSTLNMARGDEGIIARTAAAKATHDVKLREINYCRKLYQTILDKFKTAQVGDLIYTDSPLFMRVLRDIDYSTLSEICVGTKKLEESVLSTLKLIPTPHTIAVTHYGANKDMFYEVGLHDQMMGILKPRVELENGAYIIIEKTEALTSIDVNTGSFVGDNSLEETVFETNLLAADEIARQVKLRNIGGIVVVDFIDMTNEEHKKAVYEKFEKALSTDWAKCKIAPMSRFGLIEFTRKRMGISPVNLMTTTCRHCGGAGDTRSHEFILLDVRAKLLDILSKGHNFVNIDMNSGVCNKLIDWTGMIDSIKCCYPDAVIYVVPHRSYADDTITFTVCSSVAEKPENGTLLF